MAKTDMDAFIIRGRDARLRRDAEGDVVLTTPGGKQRVGRMTAAYPLTRPRRLISVRDESGEEIGILDRVRDLDPDSRQIVREELERSYFMPQITDVYGIREELNLVQWDVLTSKGPRSFPVRGVRRNVRKIGQRQFVIKDVDGNRYEIPDWMSLPTAAQKLLEPYI